MRYKGCVAQGVCGTRGAWQKGCLVQGVRDRRSVWHKGCLVQGVRDRRSVWHKGCLVQGVRGTRTRGGAGSTGPTGKENTRLLPVGLAGSRRCTTQSRDTHKQGQCRQRAKSTCQPHASFPGQRPAHRYWKRGESTVSSGKCGTCSPYKHTLMASTSPRTSSFSTTAHRNM